MCESTVQEGMVQLDTALFYTVHLCSSDCMFKPFKNDCHNCKYLGQYVLQLREPPSTYRFYLLVKLPLLVWAIRIYNTVI
jgi:hypothetical protein